MMLTSHAPFMLSFFFVSDLLFLSPVLPFLFSVSVSDLSLPCASISLLCTIDLRRLAVCSLCHCTTLSCFERSFYLSVYLQRGSWTSLNGNCTLFDTCPVNCSVYCSVYCCTSFSSLDAAANDVTGVTEDDDAVANGLPQHRATTASASIHRINLPHPNFPVSFKSYLDLHRLIHLDSSPYILQSPNDHPGEKHEDPLIRLATPPVIHD